MNYYIIIIIPFSLVIDWSSYLLPAAPQDLTLPFAYSLLTQWPQFNCSLPHFFVPGTYFLKSRPHCRVFDLVALQALVAALATTIIREPQVIRSCFKTEGSIIRVLCAGDSGSAGIIETAIIVAVTAATVVAITVAVVEEAATAGFLAAAVPKTAHPAAATPRGPCWPCARKTGRLGSC